MSTNSQGDDAESVAVVAVTTSQDIEIGVRFRYAMKMELGMSVARLRQDWSARETAYFAKRTADGGAQWFLARVGEEFIGSSCAFVDDSWASTLLERPKTGWIIGVYVLPDFRRRGIARALTDSALSWLRSTSCTEVKLHASPYGRAIYESFGFELTNEMRLALD
jgi:GNAT superfamily N-acetyltransferase